MCEYWSCKDYHRQKEEKIQDGGRRRGGETELS